LRRHRLIAPLVDPVIAVSFFDEAWRWGEEIVEICRNDPNFGWVGDLQRRLVPPAGVSWESGHGDFRIVAGRCGIALRTAVSSKLVGGFSILLQGSPGGVHR